MMRITADSNLCAGHGRCYSVLPQLIGYDVEGYSELVDKLIDVPPDMEESARSVVRNCPERAIRIVEES
jgi:ferredoxin